MGAALFLRDSHNVIEFITGVSTLAACLLNVCNDVDWTWWESVGDGPGSTEDTPIPISPETIPERIGYVWKWCDRGVIAPLSGVEFLAFSVSLRWINLVPRLTQRSTVVGPIMLSLRRMLTDVLIWLILLVWLLVAFASFMRALHAEQFGQPNNLPAGCFNPDDQFADFGNALAILFETSLSGDGQFHCYAAASTGYISRPVAYVFVVFSCIILTNMLIAMMAKTFDNVTSTSTRVFLYLMAKQVTTWNQYPPLPPPLNLLSVPYYSLNFLVLRPVLAIYHTLQLMRKGRLSRRALRSKLDENFSDSVGDALDDALGSALGASTSAMLGIERSSKRSVKTIFKLPLEWIAANGLEHVISNVDAFCRDDADNEHFQHATALNDLAKVQNEQFQQLHTKINMLADRLEAVVAAGMVAPRSESTPRAVATPLQSDGTARAEATRPPVRAAAMAMKRTCISLAPPPPSDSLPSGRTIATAAAPTTEPLAMMPPPAPLPRPVNEVTNVAHPAPALDVFEEMPEQPQVASAPEAQGWGGIFTYRADQVGPSWTPEAEGTPVETLEERAAEEKAAGHEFLIRRLAQLQREVATLSQEGLTAAAAEKLTAIRRLEAMLDTCTTPAPEARSSAPTPRASTSGRTDVSSSPSEDGPAPWPTSPSPSDIVFYA